MTAAIPGALAYENAAVLPLCLSTAAGYEVITTASPHNFDYVCKLGASQVF